MFKRISISLGELNEFPNAYPLQTIENTEVDLAQFRYCGDAWVEGDYIAIDNGVHGVLKFRILPQTPEHSEWVRGFEFALKQKTKRPAKSLSGHSYWGWRDGWSYKTNG